MQFSLPVSSSNAMKAIVQSAYGSPEVLVLSKVARPVMRETGVMVQVVAVSLHKGDWHLLTGKPYIMRAAGFGLFKPHQQIPGMAIAGRVTAVGPKVQTFQVGDEVFGEIRGWIRGICVCGRRGTGSEASQPLF